MCHSSTRPGTSYHVTQFYQAFPRISTASDKRWGEKASVTYTPYCGALPSQIAEFPAQALLMAYGKSAQTFPVRMSLTIIATDMGRFRQCAVLPI